MAEKNKMSHEEIIEDWNELFADFKIRESDLTQPTESFLTKALIFYLRKMGYCVALELDEDPSQKRSFLNKLVCHIDHIVKLTTDKCTFTYYDLIKPTPKKTSYILWVLLNYLCFYKMFKGNVIDAVQDRITTWQERSKQIAAITLENEQRRIAAAKIKNETVSLSNDLEKAKILLEEMATKRIKQKNILEKAQDMVNHLETVVMELKKKKLSVENKLVPNEEAIELQTQHDKLQKQGFEELTERKINIEKKYKERQGNVNDMNNLLEQLDDVQGKLPPALLDDLKKENLKLKQAKKNTTAAENRKEDILQMITMMQIENENLIKEENSSRLNFEQQKAERMHMIAEKENICKALESTTERVKCEEKNVIETLKEEMEIQEYLEENLTELMTPYIAE